MMYTINASNSTTAANPIAIANRLEVEARRAPALAILRSQQSPAEQPSQQWNSPVEQSTVEQPPIEYITGQVLLSPPPAWVQKRGTSGSKARGFAFEKKVGKLLSKLCGEAGWKLWDHQWFIHACAGQIKYFQPDFIIERPNAPNIVIEVKLTYVDTSLQLNRYLNYLRVFGLTCFPVTVVKNLTPEIKQKVVSDFNDVTANSVLHLWI